MNNNPTIIILDLDGTIIGDCSYQCDIYNIENTIKENKLKNKSDNVLSKCYNMKSKLMRPYFKNFILFIKKFIPNSLIFIYTASETKWAHKEISIIEKTNNIKFDRPIFTRDNCIKTSDGNYIKSINNIISSINRKCKTININNIKNNLLIIDNNNTFIDFLDNFILCPTYNYLKFFNLWNKIPEDYINNNNIKDLLNNLSLNHKISNINPYNSDCKDIEKNYKWLYKKQKKINKINKIYINDIFWKKIITIITKFNITLFNSKNINIIKKHLD